MRSLSFGLAMLCLGFSTHLAGASSYFSAADAKQLVIPEQLIRIAQNVANRRLPQFENYPAKRYRGRVSAPDLKSDPDARSYRTRLRNAAKGTPSFAGEYVVATWGCGARCLMGAVINAKSGNVIFFPGTVCCWDRNEESTLDYQLDSRLLVMRGSINEQDPVGTHYFELKNGQFRLIHMQPVSASSSNPNLANAGVRTQSSASRIASAGSDTDVNDYALINDTNIKLSIKWLDGQAKAVPPNNGPNGPEHQWILPGETWQIANGASTWESHWYAVFSSSDFVCSFSPRQHERLQFSQLSACDVSGLVDVSVNSNPPVLQQTADNKFAVGTYTSPTGPSGNIEMNSGTFALTWTEFCGPTINLTADWSFGQLLPKQKQQEIIDLDISDVGDVIGFQSGKHIYTKSDGIIMPGCVGTAKPKNTRAIPNITRPVPKITRPLPNSTRPKPTLPKLKAVADPRSQNDYSLVQPIMSDRCASKFPNSPADDRNFYNCMDQALMDSLEELEDAGSN